MDDMAGLAEAAKRELAAALESPAKALTTALPLLAVIVAVQWYRSYSRLSQFPGPRLAAWTKLPLIRWSASGRAHLQYLELTETYGKFTWYYLGSTADSADPARRDPRQPP